METIVIQLKNDIIDNRIELSTPMSIIKHLVTVVEKEPDLSSKGKKQMVLKVIKVICSGKDGILGTEDDLFPVSLVNGLDALFQSGVIDEIVDLAHTAVVKYVPYRYRILEFVFVKIYKLFYR